jgi:hypothetical protein
VSSLSRELPGKMTVRLIASTEPEAKAQVRANDWRSHGAIVKRGSRIIYRAGDHRVNVNDIHYAITHDLGWGPECREP